MVIIVNYNGFHSFSTLIPLLSPRHSLQYFQHNRKPPKKFNMDTSIIPDEHEPLSRVHPKTGRVTLPVEAGKEDLVHKMIDAWGADAIRDSDGTELSEELKQLNLDIYSVICLVRAEQEWPRKHPEHLPQKYLISEAVTARGTEVEIDLMRGYHPRKYRVDTINDARKYWEVIDRTTGAVVPVGHWSFDASNAKVRVTGCNPYHVYTVNFLAYVTWDATSMYNHITNGWDRPRVMSVDPYHPECREHLMRVYEKWLDAHPQTNVVRLTTLAYHFAVDSAPGETAPDRFRDWTGYQETVSVRALEDFAREYGYRMRPEDFVDQGFYNHTSRVPSQRYLDWIEFIHRFVVDFGREMVERANARGKRTGIFWGDHWTGVEPYSPAFQKMGVDIHIGAAEDGVALRRVSDAPGPQVKELRFYPYFFPDVFADGGNPIEESLSNWLKIRRAMLRQPVDRIGYGGYLSLATKFPDFVDHVRGICEEFRELHERTRGSQSWKGPVKVAILNAWGKRRAWINSFGIPQKFLIKRPDVIQVAGTNLLECLAGLPVEVEWLSLAEIEQSGVPGDISVIINDGDADTAWSGGHWWINPKVAAAVRAFVDSGGGLIGCRAPTAHFHEGRFFQLSDVFGVEKELGHSVQTACPRLTVESDHFIRADTADSFDPGIRHSHVFATDPTTTAIYEHDGHLLVTAHPFGKGRAVFMAELPYSLPNARVLYRSILWAAGREDLVERAFSTNPLTDCAFYEDSKCFAVANNSGEKQRTTVYYPDGSSIELDLRPHGIEWLGDTSV